MLSFFDEIAFNVSVGQHVRARRRALGYSTSMVSDHLGMALSEYVAAELGEAAFTLLQTGYLACFLDVRLSDFFADTASEDAIPAYTPIPVASWMETRGNR